MLIFITGILIGFGIGGIVGWYRGYADGRKAIIQTMQRTAKK